MFGKKIPDAQWERALRPIYDAITQTRDAFDIAGDAVQDDPIAGWVGVKDVFSILPAFEKRVKAAEKTYKKAGKPESRDVLIETAKTALDEFFRAARLAFHWGKPYYRDASGGPGQRAMYETGFAQKAAIKRVRHSGTRFAENALQAATAGRAALEALGVEPHSQGRPPLFELLLGAAQPGLLDELQRLKSVPLSQLAILGSWCYSRAAILGMVASSYRYSDSVFVAPVWHPAKIDRFWRYADEELERLDALAAGGGIAGLRNQTGYPELYGEEAMLAARSGDFEHIKKLAATKLPLSWARVRWSMDTAMGLGVGLLRPDFIRERLEAEANPDPRRWAEAHQAGLDIPPQPDAMPAAEQVESLLDVCRPFLQEYYPDTFEALVEAIERDAGA